MHQLIAIVVLATVVLFGAAAPASQAVGDGNWGSALGLIGWPFIIFFASEWTIYGSRRRRREATIGGGFLPREVYPSLAVAIILFAFALAGRNA